MYHFSLLADVHEFLHLSSRQVRVVSAFLTLLQHCVANRSEKSENLTLIPAYVTSDSDPWSGTRTEPFRLQEAFKDEAS